MALDPNRIGAPYRSPLELALAQLFAAATRGLQPDYDTERLIATANRAMRFPVLQPGRRFFGVIPPRGY